MAGPLELRAGIITAVIEMFDGRFPFEPANFEKGVGIGQFAEINPVPEASSPHESGRPPIAR